MAKRKRKTRFGRYLEDLGLTYYKVAVGTGINPANISNWARGKSCPRMDKYATLREHMRDKYGIILTTHDFITYNDDEL